MAQAEKNYRESEITLRRFELSDVDDFMAWASDDRVTRFCTWDSYKSKDDLLRYMAETVLPHPWFRAICVSARPVGAVSLCRAAGGGNRCRGELGYVLAAEQWGKGVATEAVRLAVAAAFGEEEGLERVEALVDVDNVGSQRVLEKAGFAKEGVLRKYMVLRGTTRDMVMFSFVSCPTRDAS